MSNLLQLINKTATIDEKANKIFSDLIAEYNHGTIKTETELLYKLFGALNDFYASIGKPTFKFYEAKGTPVSEHFNSMISSAVADISSLIAEGKNLTQVLEQSFTEIELDRKMLQNRVKYIVKTLEKAKIAAMNSRNGILFSDSFVNSKLMDAGMIKGTAASINTTEGVLILNKQTSNDYSTNCNVEILPGSNGFPGNTHVIDTLDANLHFNGEDNLHVKLADIIDGNSDTWFEYESFAVTNEVFEKTVGLGFNYKENVSWVTEDSALRLILRVTLKTPKLCNWLSLNPFIPEHKGSIAAAIKRIIISDGKGAVQSLVSTRRSFNDDIIYIFNSQTVKTITVEFEQLSAYDIDIGHFYYTEVTGSNEMYFNESSSLAGRVDGPAPSLELLGMRYDSRNQTLVHPKLDENSGFIDEAQTKSGLFNFSSDSELIKMGKEIIRAQRFHIGIKGINISNYTFAAASEYISVPYETDESISSISVDVGEIIPSSYGAGEWVKYSISIDDGQTWYSIVPISRAHTGKSVYYINSNTPLELRHPANGYIDLNYDIKSLRFKIELSRPGGTTDLYTTPIVSGYNIKVMTGGV